MEIEIRERDDNIIWHKKGDRSYWHREDGPAYIGTYDNREDWYYYDVKYYSPKQMPLNLFIAYCRWEYKKNGN